jgi:hypothetical protein
MPARKSHKPNSPKGMPKGELPKAGATQPFLCSILAARALTDLQNPPSSMTSVILTDLNGSFADVEFFAVDEAKREILAVALAAISTQSNVGTVVDVPTGVSNPQCYSLTIIP